jgi:hypothetical protein
MKYVFVNGRVAVIVRYWEQHGPVVDGGARIELRRVEQVEGDRHRAGAAGFTVLPVSDGGLWRADLFMVLSEPGTPCFHYHPQFRNDDVGPRCTEDDLTANPRRWIAERLTDITGTLERAGAGDLVPSLDLDQHRRALPAMLAAVDACLAQVPAALAAHAAHAAKAAEPASA